MLITLYVVGGLAVVGLAMLIHAAVAAPMGSEDEHGFHLTNPVEPPKPPAPQALPLSAADLSFFTN